MESKKYEHFIASEVFKAVMNHGGPEMWDEYCELFHPNFSTGSSQKLYFPDWDVINEFWGRDWTLWWKKAAEIMEIEPGDTVYLDSSF